MLTPSPPESLKLVMPPAVVGSPAVGCCFELGSPFNEIYNLLIKKKSTKQALFHPESLSRGILVVIFYGKIKQKG